MSNYQVSYDLRSDERNLSNCVKKPEKVRTSTGFEPVTSRYRCDALTNFHIRSSIYETFHISLHRESTATITTTTTTTATTTTVAIVATTTTTSTANASTNATATKNFTNLLLWQ